jgi:diphosphomevalonate decarboxylase
MNVFENSAIETGRGKNFFWATAPSNIALVKYMGKSCSKNNIAENVSLSFTLKEKLAKVELHFSDSWQWQPLTDFGVLLDLSKSEQEKYIEFAKTVAQELGIKEAFLIKSGCNFPISCGIASSAASFAALTSSLVNVASVLVEDFKIDFDTMVNLSQQGSGSSVRSFLSDWVVWDSIVKNVKSNVKDCRHKVVVVSSAKKLISSSAAHKLVKTSLLYENREKRAYIRYSKIKQALLEKDWFVIFEQSWQDFWDMHSLFHTSSPGFSYINSATLDVLDAVKVFWQKHQDGPVVTLDAGANVHLLYRDDQTELINIFIKSLDNQYLIL